MLKITRELKRTTKSPEPGCFTVGRRLRPLYLATASLATGGVLSLALSSLNFELNLPIHQLHVAWNLTRILIEF